MLKHRARALRHRPAQAGRPRRRHLVEVEDRAAQRRLRARLRAGRPRPARQRLHRLHLRGLEPHAAPTPPRREAAIAAIARKRAARRRARCSSSPFAKAYSGLTDEEFTRVDTRRSAAPRWRSSARCAASGRRWCSSSASKASTAARATRAASRCASRACCAIRDDKPLHEADTMAVARGLAGAAAGRRIAPIGARRRRVTSRRGLEPGRHFHVRPPRLGGISCHFRLSVFTIVLAQVSTFEPSFRTRGHAGSHWFYRGGRGFNRTPQKRHCSGPPCIAKVDDVIISSIILQARLTQDAISARPIRDPQSS